MMIDSSTSWGNVCARSANAYAHHIVPNGHGNPTYIIRPPKAVSEMTDEELDAWAEIADAMAAKVRGE